MATLPWHPPPLNSPPPPGIPRNDLVDDIRIIWTTFVTTHAGVALVYLLFLLGVPFKRDVSRRERVRAYFLLSKVGHALTTVHAFASLASCVLFVSEAYLVPEFGTYALAYHDYRRQLPLAYLLAEQSLQPIFVYHYAITFYVAGSRRVAYVFSLMSLIDLVTVVPVYLDLYSMLHWRYTQLEAPSSSGSSDSGVIALNFLRLLRATKVIRIVRLSGVYSAISNILSYRSVAASALDVWHDWHARRTCRCLFRSVRPLPSLRSP